jgi:type III pantothenate kinase
MHLLIDVGNSRIKWRLVDHEYTTETACHDGTLKDLALFISSLIPEEISVSLAAVNQTEDLKNLLGNHRFKHVHIAHSEASQRGLKNSYEHPERMGVDRWLAMIAVYSAARNKKAQQGFIIVDAGSAMTIDVVSPSGEHVGGYIVPGLQMAQRALFANTERVIQYDEKTASTLYGKHKRLGNNTLECVEYGVINQLVALVKSVEEAYSGYEIIFTGGDSELLAGYFEAGTVDRDLVLKGLWQVRN